jgi:hypothetical protein
MQLNTQFFKLLILSILVATIILTFKEKSYAQDDVKLASSSINSSNSLDNRILNNLHSTPIPLHLQSLSNSNYRNNTRTTPTPFIRPRSFVQFIKYESRKGYPSFVALLAFIAWVYKYLIAVLAYIFTACIWTFKQTMRFLLWFTRSILSLPHVIKLMFQNLINWVDN